MKVDESAKWENGKNKQKNKIYNFLIVVFGEFGVFFFDFAQLLFRLFRVKMKINRQETAADRSQQQSDVKQIRIAIEYVGNEFFERNHDKRESSSGDRAEAGQFANVRHVEHLNVEARGGGVDESSDDCMKDESDDLDVDVFLKKNQKAENEQTRDGDDVGVARVAQLLNTLESGARIGRFNFFFGFSVVFGKKRNSVVAVARRFGQFFRIFFRIGEFSVEHVANRDRPKNAERLQVAEKRRVFVDDRFDFLLVSHVRDLRRVLEPNRHWTNVVRKS